MFLAVKKATLLVHTPTQYDPNKKHLFILLTNPSKTENLVLTVSLNSIKEDEPFDNTCTLDVGDHKFIRHPSWINYRFAEISPASKYLTGVEKDLFKDHGEIKTEIFIKICQGLYNSPFTKRSSLDFYMEACEADQTELITSLPNE